MEGQFALFLSITLAAVAFAVGWFVGYKDVSKIYAQGEKLSHRLGFLHGYVEAMQDCLAGGFSEDPLNRYKVFLAKQEEQDKALREGYDATRNPAAN